MNKSGQIDDDNLQGHGQVHPRAAVDHGPLVALVDAAFEVVVPINDSEH